jgi:tetratricopeptide (TPR) repeat protein
MTKRAAIIIVFLCCALVVGLVVLIYKNNINVSPQAYSEAVDAFYNNDADAVIKSLEGKTDDTDERLLLASAYLQVGSVGLAEEEGFAKAKPLLLEVLAENANDTEALRLMAYGYEITEQYQVALSFYDKSIKADIGNAAAYSGKGHALALMGRIDEAIREYQSALSIESNLDHAELGLARLYIKKDINRDRVQEYLDDVTKNSPNKRFVAEAFQMKGALLLNESKYKEALPAFDASIAADSTLAQSYVGRAQASFALIDASSENEEYLDGIMKDLEKATELNENLTVAYYYAGVVMEYTGKKDFADALFAQALEVADNDISLSADEKATMKALITESIN